MKKHFYLISSIIILLWLACTTLNAQKYNLKTEVLVYFMPDSLEVPAHENGQLGLQRATVKSSTLASVLAKAKVKSIAKAFPAWANKDSIMTRFDGKQVEIPPFHRIFSLAFYSEAAADSAIIALRKSAAVIFAEKNTKPTLDNDVLYTSGSQWNLINDGRNGGIAGSDINAEGAWSIYTGNSSNKIAIIDTGVELTHEDLNGKVTGENHYGNSHGTMVAGVAAAKANNSLGIRGLDWNAQIISKNISDASGYYIGDAAMTQKIIDAVNEGANVLNRSGSSPDYSSTLAMGFAYAYKMDRVSVATMGNTGIQEVRYPAALPNVIAVGATQNNDVISNFSTTGNHIDVVAPGGSGWGGATDILTTSIGNSYEFTAGTSFSAPQVTGLASLMKGYKSNLSNDDIRQIIRLSADDRGALGFDNQYGYGRINAGRAMSYLKNPYAIVQNTASTGTIISTSNQFVAQFISATGLATGNYLVKRIEIQKIISLPENLYNILGVWGRGAFSTGWSIASLNFGEGFCEIVPGSLTSTNATLRTYVYQVWNMGGSYLGYYPASPTGAIFAYSVLGSEKPNILGSSLLCDQATYTIDNFPPGASVTWSATPSNLVSLQPNGSSVIVTKMNSGNITLTATINSSITISKEVSVSPVSTIGLSSYTNLEMLDDQAVYFKILPSGTAWTYRGNLTVSAGSNNTYSWSQLSSYPNDIKWTANGANIDVYTRFANKTVVLRCKANSGCNSSTKDYTFTTSNLILETMSLFPNPATNEVSVSLNEELVNAEIPNTSSNLKTLKDKTHTIQLWNSTSLIKSVSTKDPTYKLSLNGVSTGFYYVHVISDDKIYRKQLIVK